MAATQEAAPGTAAALLGLLRVGRRDAVPPALRPVDLCAATGWDFGVDVDVARGVPPVPAPDAALLARLVRAACGDTP